MATVSRLILAHPALGTAGGASLHTAIEALYQKIGDAIADRFYQITDFDNGESVDCEHNFDTDIVNLRWDIYVFTGGQWVRTSDDTSPLRSAFTVAETVGFEDTKLTITNVSAGNDLLVAFVVVNDPISLEDGDIIDIDITTTPPEDGQALVYNSTIDKFKPGASGDSSFKIQSVTDPSAVIKGGYLLDPMSGAEYATYDGAGSASTDFGVDLTINLDTILGSDPSNATNYILAIDRETLAGPVTLTDNGRRLVAVTEANFALLTTALTSPSFNKSRYLPIGNIKSATTGTVWSGSGSAFITFATRIVDPMAGSKYNKFIHPAIVAPNFYASLTAANAAATSGDRFLLLSSYTITSAETISASNVLIDFAPGVALVIDAAVKGLIISGSDVEINGAKYTSAFVGTVPAGIEVTGNDCNIEKAKVESTNAGTTITDAFLISGSRNRVTGIAKATAGTITNPVTDNGTSSDFNVRS